MDRARGTRCPAAKLNEDLVRVIRRNQEGLTDRARAAMLGVHPNVIYRVRHGYAWGWVR